MTEAVDGYKDKFESVAIAEPLLGEVGDDATVINDDKKAVAEAITAEAVKKQDLTAWMQQKKTWNSICIHGTWNFSYSKCKLSSDADTDGRSWIQECISSEL